MEITLEKIELVRDRTGVTYKEAKDALEATGGNVVDAIISIEAKVDGAGSTNSTKAKKDALVSKMKSVFEKGNVSKILVTREGETILNIPLTIGILGSVIAPYGLIAGVVAAFGFKCKIQFVKDDGSIVDLSEKAGDLYDTAKEKGQDLYDDIKEKAPAAFEELKEKGEDAFNKAMEAASKAKNKISKYGDDLNDVSIEIDFDDIADVEEEAETEIETEDK